MRHGLPLLVLLVLAGACGGSSGGGEDPTPTPVPEELTLIEDRHEGIFMGSSTLTYVLTAEMGDDSFNQPGRVLFRFSLASVPANAQVTSAVLTLHRTLTVGDAHLFGDMLADHVDWPLGAPATSSLMYDDTILAEFGTCLPGPLPIGIPRLYTLQVGPRVQADLDAARTSSTFRFHFSDVQSDNDGADDRYKFEGPFGNPSVNYQAQILVEYLTP